jgi:hypothetical protein
MPPKSPIKRPVGRPKIGDGVRQHLVIQRPILERIESIMPEVTSLSNRVNILLAEALKARRA